MFSLFKLKALTNNLKYINRNICAQTQDTNQKFAVLSYIHRLWSGQNHNSKRRGAKQNKTKIWV
jgi:hypothetical protein